jgi:DNA primase
MRYTIECMATTVEQVKAKLTIEQVVGYYVHLQRAGANFKAKCPFHNEKSASFHVSPSRNSWHCFGCNVGGDMFSFIEQIEGVDFKGALKILAEKAGVPLVYEKSDKNDTKERQFKLLEDAACIYEGIFKNELEAREYVRGRGIHDTTAHAFRIGFAPDSWDTLAKELRTKGYTDTELLESGLCVQGNRGLYDRFRSRIMFPLNDSAGRSVAFSGRVFNENSAKTLGETPGKYINSPETGLYSKSAILYGYDRAKLSMRKLNAAVLVEGQMDLVMAHQAGWTNTVAVSGTALTEMHVQLLKRMTDNLLLALDSDAAGTVAALRSARLALAASMQVKVAEIEGGKDPAEIIKNEGADAFREVIKNAKPLVTFLLDAFEKESRDPASFRIKVLKEVAPLSQCYQSHIEKEAMLAEVAERLKVSTDAVVRDVVRMAGVGVQAPGKGGELGSLRGAATPRPLETHPTASMPVHLAQLVGVALWQEALEKPSIDTAEVIREIERITGHDMVAHVRDRPKNDAHRYSFRAEQMFGGTHDLKKVVGELLLRLEKEHVSELLRRAVDLLRATEGEGSDSAIALAKVDALTKRLQSLQSTT